jgi:hypothetical protein
VHHVRQLPRMSVTVYKSLQHNVTEDLNHLTSNLAGVKTVFEAECESEAFIVEVTL